MIARASAKFVRISPRKVRYVIDLIRQKDVRTALGVLNGSPRRAGGIVKRLLNQALDAAKRNSQVEAKDLFVSRVTADGGPSLKRFRSMSMGRAGMVRKRTSHIELELDLRNRALAQPQAPKMEKAARSGAVPSPAAAAKKAAKDSGKKTLAGAK